MSQKTLRSGKKHGQSEEKDDSSEIGSGLASTVVSNPGGAAASSRMAIVKARGANSKKGTSSIRSSSLRNANVRKKEIELGTREALLELDEEENKLNYDIDMLVMELETQGKQLTARQEALANLAPEDDAERGEMKKKVCCLREKIEENELLLLKKRAKMTLLLSTNAKRRELVNEGKALENDKIDEDNEQLGVDEDLPKETVPPQERIDSLLKDVDSLGKKGATAIKIDEEETALNEAEQAKIEAKTKELEAKLKRAKETAEAALQKAYTQAQTQEQEDKKKQDMAKKKQEILDHEAAEAAANQAKLEEELRDLQSRNAGSGKKVTETASPVDQLVQMMCQAFGKVTPATLGTSEVVKTNEFFARQSTRKDLPIFSGRPEDWPSFLSNFKRLTKLCNLSNDENLFRLEKCLKGDARKAVESLFASPDNVPVIMKKLEIRFGQPKHIIDAMLNKVRMVNAVKEYQLETLIEFGTIVSNLTATIEALDCKEYLSNPQLLKELEMKLTPNYRLQWLDWLDNGQDRKENLSCFSQWLDARVEKACRLCPPKGKDDKPEPHHQNWKKNNFGKAVAVHAIDGDSPAKNEGKCNGCGKDGHWIKDCRKLKSMNLNNRWKVVNDKKLCPGCLIPGHSEINCRRKRACGLNGCKLLHNQMLHPDEAPGQKKDNKHANVGQQANVVRETKRDEGRQSPTNTPEGVHITSVSSAGTLMRVLPVVLEGPKGRETVYAFLDDGASISLIEEDLAQDLGLDGTLAPLCVGTLNGVTSENNSRKVSFKISGDHPGAKEYKMKEVRTVSVLKLQKSTQDMMKLGEKWPHLRGLPLDSFKEVRPRILIGISDTYLSSPLQHVGNSQNAPIAFKSRLGWSVGGPQRGSENDSMAYFHHVCEVEDDVNLHQLVKKSFAIEDLGIKKKDERPRSKEDKRAMEIMRETTKRVEGTARYETGLLWKSPEVVLPESRGSAYNRLLCQERKMDKDPEFAKQYVAKMAEYSEKGFIRKVTQEELQVKNDREWYLPHFAHFNPNKPGKLRLVFDAAAMSHGTSLNNNLVQGPDLANALIAVLWKFRQHQIAFTGDVKDMFHRVFIRKEDQPSQRFLWRGMDRTQPPDVYQMSVMVFGATCSPSCAQYVKNLVAEEYQEKFGKASKAIIKKFYVDDYLDSKPGEGEAIIIIKEVSSIMNAGGFEVCNWMSNSKKVMESIPAELRAKDVKELDLDNSELPIGRILGLWWNPEGDHFTFKLNYNKVPADIVSGESRPTKRDVLKLVMSIYDPLGFLGHLVVKAKILLQEIWKCGTGWDDELPDDLFAKWIDWLGELKGITGVRIPRCYSPNIPKSKNIQLHMFSDASEKAYSAVAYLRIETEEGTEVSFVSAKTKVCPLKTVSIPRLELQAALMSALLAKSIKQDLEIPINSTTYWVDAATVLKWLRSDSGRFKQFVSHRLGEIQETTEVEEWRWVPTKLNVADDATRNDLPADLRPTSRWFTGESFLREPKEQWPVEKPGFVDSTLRAADLEEKEAVMATMIEDKWLPIAERFSSWMRLIRTTAWIKRFLKNHGLDIKDRQIGPLSMDEFRNTVKTWAGIVQRQCFPEELKLLNGGKPLNKNSKLRKLSPTMQDGLIRVGGRIHNAYGIAEDVRHPILLDASHWYVKLLVEWYHIQAGHQGKQTVANELRQKYFVIGVSNLVKKVAFNCRACYNRKVKPAVPEMGNLPAERLESRIKPFTNTGLDLFGPMTVTIGRRKEKRWGALFTCLSTRAVHLELVDSLDTSATINAIVRFSNLRGRPSKIVSDNGTNFHGANNELKRNLVELSKSQDEIHDKLMTKGIEWIFNPPAAPHMGGVWERLVRSVKTVLHVILKEREPKEDILRTLFTEVSWILNSRPLTDVSLDPKDLESLTPNHFLLGWSGGIPMKIEEASQTPIGVFDKSDEWTRKQWRTAQRLGDLFWSRWVKEYLPTLTKRGKWFSPVNPIKIGDIVIIADDQAPRNVWLKGIVTAVFPGQDGRVRVADVKCQHGTYRRPVAKLCVLNVRATDDEADGVCSSGGRMLGGTSDD